MQQMNRRTRRTGFTLIELLVVIAVIAILAGLLFPVFARAKRSAATTTCGSNLSQISRVILQYANDNNGRMPRVINVSASGAENWNANNSAWKSTNGAYKDLLPYIKDDKIFQCPGTVCDNCFQMVGSVRTRIEIDYRFNPWMNLNTAGQRYRTKGIDENPRPSQFYLVSDRHSVHHFDGRSSSTDRWIMLMVMGDGHLKRDVRPYRTDWTDSRGQLKYDHWDFPNCHAMDQFVLNEY